jgi:hypothetical protein
MSMRTSRASMSQAAHIRALSTRAPPPHCGVGEGTEATHPGKTTRFCSTRTRRFTADRLHIVTRKKRT